MNNLVRVMTALFIMLVAPAFAQTTTIASSQFNAWNISSFRYQNTGLFSHCAASAPYRSGILLLFSINERMEWTVGFANPRWRLNEGSNINLQYYIDNDRPISGSAFVSSPSLLLMRLPDDRHLFQRMRAGRILYVNAAGYSVQFALTGTSIVLQTLLSCVSSNGANVLPQVRQPVPIQPSPPNIREAQPSQPPNTRPETTADQRLEATQFASNILNHDGMRGIRLLTLSQLRQSDLPEFFRSSDVVWQGPSIIGSLRVVSGRGASDLDTLAAEIISSDARSCRGEFATGRTADADLPTSRRIQTFCSGTEGQSVTFAYLLLPMPGGVVYQISTLGFGDRQASNTQDQRVRDAVRAVVLRQRD